MPSRIKNSDVSGSSYSPIEGLRAGIQQLLRQFVYKELTDDSFMAKNYIHHYFFFNVKHAIAWNIYSLVHPQSFKKYKRV